MKHISLFEFYSDMPKEFSVQEIENMTEDQFLMNVKKLVDAKDEEQLFTMLQIWIHANKKLPMPNGGYSEDGSFETKLGSALGGSPLQDLFINKNAEMIHYKRTKKHEESLKEILQLKRDIETDEKMLRMSKDRLRKLQIDYYQKLSQTQVGPLFR